MLIWQICDVEYDALLSALICTVAVTHQQAYLVLPELPFCLLGNSFPVFGPERRKETQRCHSAADSWNQKDSASQLCCV